MDHHIDNELLIRVTNRIEAARDEMIELQRGLCAHPALGPSSGGTGEMVKASWLMERLSDWGFPEPEYYPAPSDEVPEGERPNYIVRLPGESHDRTTWVLTHLDVVPPGEESMWSGDPWTLRVEGGKLFGRGVEDNQQGMVSGIFAFRALLEEGIIPPHDVALAFVADEETGSHFGAQYLMEHHRNLFEPDDLLLIPDAGDEDGTMIEVAEKSIGWFLFTVRGRQTHGSTPDHGVNAHKAGAHLIVLLEQLYEDFPARDDLFDPPVSTFEPTMKKANVENINTIPGEDVFAFDCRVMPAYSLDDVRARIEVYAREVEQTFGVTVGIETPSWQPAAPPTSPEALIVSALGRAVKHTYGVDARPMGIGGGTVASFFRKAGIPAAVWSRMDDQAHMPDEYCVIDYMVGDATVMAYLFLES
ncbi:M20 family metallo-hydrolase [Gemmatimonadota bacterium]